MTEKELPLEQEITDETDDDDDEVVIYKAKADYFAKEDNSFVFGLDFTLKITDDFTDLTWGDKTDMIDVALKEIRNFILDKSTIKPLTPAQYYKRRKKRKLDG